MFSYRWLVNGLLVFFLGFSFTPVWGMEEADDEIEAPFHRGGIRVPGYGYGYDKGTAKILGKIQLAEQIAKAKKHRENELRALRARLGRARGKEDKDKLQKEVDDCESYVDMLERRHKILLQPSTTGNLIAVGIAGKEGALFLEDADIEDIWSGISKGFIIRAAQAAGNVFSKKVGGTMQVVLGGTWDYFFGKLSDGWDSLSNALFHDSQQSFTLEELGSWKAFIKESFEQIEQLLKEGLRESLRGHDMTLRQFESSEEDAEKGESKKKTEEEAFSLWSYLMVGYAEQLDRFVSEMEKRKSYYGDVSLECFYANQIQNRLLAFRKVLLQANSLREFDALIDSNKSLITTVKKNVISLFDRLEGLIKPRSYSLDDKTAAYERVDGGSKHRIAYDDDLSGFPHPMGH